MLGFLYVTSFIFPLLLIAIITSPDVTIGDIRSTILKTFIPGHHFVNRYKTGVTVESFIVKIAESDNVSQF